MNIPDVLFFFLQITAQFPTSTEYHESLYTREISPREEGGTSVRTSFLDEDVWLDFLLTLRLPLLKLIDRGAE